MKTRMGILVLLALVAGCGSSERGPSAAPRIRPPELQPIDNGFFSMQVPAGWQLVPAGDCASLAFVLQDPQEPLRKILYFGTVGPVYQTPAQKQIDWQYMSGYGYPVEWADMPAVEPLTPENLLANFSQIAASQIAQRFMPGCPRLDGFQVVSSVPLPCPLPVAGARSALVRGLFVENGRLAEGLFSLTTAPYMPMLGGPGGGTAYGYLLAGIAAPKGELDALQPTLSRALASFAVRPEYVQNCLMRSEAAFGAVLRAGQTLRETSDLIARGWEERNRRDDLVAEKRSDAILGKERLYDPDTGEVYEFNNGFYDEYRLNPQGYRNRNLQPLPDDDPGPWSAATRDGYRYLGD
ncbi:MAG: hypothetical protein AB7V22_05620 [Kiritimatiellia bacterium]